MTLYLDDEDVRLIHGDCIEVMAGMDEASVDAIVTSPPYARPAQLRARRRRDRPHAEQVEALARGGADALCGRAPVPSVRGTGRRSWRTGTLALNLGVIMRDGEESEYADEILRRARRSGWKLLHRIIWHKENSIPLSHPTYLHIKHEYVFWLARSTDAYRGFDADTRSPHSLATVRRIGQPYMTRKDERYMRRGKTHGIHPDGARPATVFAAAVGGETGIEHPAIMPLKLARHLVCLTCPPGGLVLDPFAGSGTTLVAARSRSRRAVGIEEEAKYLPVAAERLKQLTLLGGAA